MRVCITVVSDWNEKIFDERLSKVADEHYWLGKGNVTVGMYLSRDWGKRSLAIESSRNQGVPAIMDQTISPIVWVGGYSYNTKSASALRKKWGVHYILRDKIHKIGCFWD